MDLPTYSKKDGFSLARSIREKDSGVPILFLTAKNMIDDKLEGFGTGADDYITKPFDIEELKLRVKNAIDRVEREKSMDPVTGLPAGKLIEDQLRELMRKTGTWTYIDVKINNFDPFREVYGVLAAQEVLKLLSKMLIEVVDEFGKPDDFVGLLGGNQPAPATRPATRTSGRHEFAAHENLVFPASRRRHDRPLFEGDLRGESRNAGEQGCCTAASRGQVP